MWDLTKLNKTPKVWDASNYINKAPRVFYDKTKKKQTPIKGVKPIWIEGETMQGQPTRTFAWYGLPDNARQNKKVPAVVLIHGGGGCAFANWVKMWNKRGYAAIAMAHFNTVPTAEVYGKWMPHPYSGPSFDNVFRGVDTDPKEQWAYHAVASITRCHSFLRSLDAVDNDNIAVTGISWGGFLTSIVMAIDPRYKCAVPVYGCGFLKEDSIWQRDEELRYIGKENAEKWYKLWDPSNFLPQATLPTLWVTGTNDFAYNLMMLEKSRRKHGAKPSLSIEYEYGHSHVHGWQRKEVAAFIDSHCKAKPELNTFGPIKATGNEVQCQFSGERSICGAQLLYTTDHNPAYSRRKYKTKAAKITGNTISAKLPAKCSAAILNITDTCGNIISSPIKFFK